MNSHTQEWLFACASVRGKGHVDAGLPNQDSLHLCTSADESCFSLAISDGAGSASRAEEGSAYFAQTIGASLLTLVQDVHAQRVDGSSRNQINDRILQIITGARQSLDTSGANLRDFAANLMALAMGPSWGLKVHLGDAVLLKSRFELRPDKTVDYFVDTQMTEQSRSEYANETNFLTQHDWTQHLVWTMLDPNGPEDLFALMTDGCGEVALSTVPGDGLRVFRGFFAPVIAQTLRAEPDARNAVLHDALANPQTYRLTGDDKTMALVMRKRCWKHASTPPALTDSQAPKATLPHSAPPAPLTPQLPPGQKKPSTPPAGSTLTLGAGTQGQGQSQGSGVALPLGNGTGGAPTGARPLKTTPTPPPIAARRHDWALLTVALAVGIALGAGAAPAYRWGQSSLTTWQTAPTAPPTAGKPEAGPSRPGPAGPTAEKGQAPTDEPESQAPSEKSQQAEIAPAAPATLDVGPASKGEGIAGAKAQDAPQVSVPANPESAPSTTGKGKPAHVAERKATEKPKTGGIE